MPVADDRARFNNRRVAPYDDQDDRCRHRRNRRRRVHSDAQRAMIGIPVQRVHMRHLDHGQQGQQDQTQKSRYPKSAWLPAAPAEICL
jgi:hypothetical protein